MRATALTPRDTNPSARALRDAEPSRVGAIVRGTIALLRGLMIVLLSALLLPYLVVPVYMFHKPASFTGAALYNPYADVSAGTAWKRANFHAHSRAWAGITSGKQSPDEVRAAYAQLGYDVIGISNYHQITRAAGDTAFLPIYEHGFSIRKSHQLVLGARGVMNVDFPIWQTTHAKQYVLERLRDSTALTAIVHPYLRTGYTLAQLTRLSGYDLLEVRSHWADASAWWDAALGDGNPVWAIGNDDMHDLTKPREVGVVWTEVNASSTQPATVLGALKRGDMYVVAGHASDSLARLVGVEVHGDTVTTRFDRAVDSARVVVDGGLVRANHAQVGELSYVLDSMDHYARVVARSAGSTIILNPVIRSNGVPQPLGVPPRRPLATIVTRLSAFLIWLCAVLLLLPSLRFWSPRGRRMSSVRRTILLAIALGSASTTLRAQSLAPATGLPFRSGEYHEYDVKFGVIGVGTGSLSVSGPETLRGREVLRLKYEIRGGIPFFRVNDVMESWFDTGRMLSLRFTQELKEGPKRYSRFYDFYPDESIVLERGQPRAPSVPQPLDDASFIYFVRTLALDVGKTMTFPRYFRPNANPVTIQVLRKESVTVPAGTFDAVVVKPTIRTSGIFSEGGEAELWFSDDSSHTLLQMKAKLSFGSINLYLRPPRNRR